MIGWKVKTDKRGKYFALFHDGTEVQSAHRVYQDVLDRITPIQRGMVFINSWAAIQSYANAKLTLTPDLLERAMIQTYAMCHTINDDPEATIPLKII